MIMDVAFQLTVTQSSALYLSAALCFILALRGLAHPETARRGNLFGMMGMTIAILVTLLAPQVHISFSIVLALMVGGFIGIIIAKKIAMTDLPQLVAFFHSLVGLSATLVAIAAYLNPASYGIGEHGLIPVSSRIEMILGGAIGAMTFTGSLIAAGKLQGIITSAPVIFRLTHYVNGLMILAIFASIFFFASHGNGSFFFFALALAILLGVTLIIPIGGADMPVVVSMLNSYSGWAAAGIGFTLDNHLLIITGALVGSSGAILSYIMCKAMNRSFISVILGGFGSGDGGRAASPTAHESRPVKEGNADDAAFILKNASSIIIVPGYGLAVAQAQHAVQEMTDRLQKNEAFVRYAIHPVAGRMPGHMNVLLAEAQTPYDDVFELDDINKDFAQTEVAFVIGANDITNPAAKNDPQSPIYGMPILDVGRAQTVLFCKRSLGAGYAGIENELFFRNNTMMLFGDAKRMVESILKAL